MAITLLFAWGPGTRLWKYCNSDGSSRERHVRTRHVCDAGVTEQWSTQRMKGVLSSNCNFSEPAPEALKSNIEVYRGIQFRPLIIRWS